MPINCTATEIEWERVNLTLMVHAVIDDSLPARPAPSAGDRAQRRARARQVRDDADEGSEEFDDEPEAVAETESPVASGDVETQAAGPADLDTLGFIIKDQEREFPVEADALGDGWYRLRFRITEFRDRRQVPDGSWRIVPVVRGRHQYPVTFPLERAHELDSSGRNFMYSNNSTAYVVSFGFSEADERPDFIMRAYQLFRTGRKVDVPLLRRARATVDNRANRVKAAKAWYQLQRRLDPPNGRRILFASEARGQLEGNLLAVHDRMVERGLDEQFEFRYSFRLPSTNTRKSTLEAIRLLATSDIVLIDDYFGMLAHLDIDPSTRIVQLWHAGSGFKSIGYSRFGRYGSPTLSNAHRKYTYAIAGSTHLAHVYAEAFGIEESSVIPTGLPRIDKFLDEQRTAQVVRSFFEDHPQLRGKRIVLFAPTFRGRGMRDAYYDYSKLDMDALYDACGDDTVVLFRKHHFIPEPVPIKTEHRDRFHDFSSFPDGNDLLLVTDVLVTDYSSIIYEYSLLNRPMLFFAYDKVVYEVTRGFHRDYESTAPGKVCQTSEELIEALRTEDFEMEKIERFREENFDVIDTHASDRVIDQLILDTPDRAGAVHR
jgi:CDP-ribitol ribitolphosphotransferase